LQQFDDGASHPIATFPCIGCVPFRAGYKENKYPIGNKPLSLFINL
jgi:hypothetical protein